MAIAGAIACFIDMRVLKNVTIELSLNDSSNYYSALNPVSYLMLLLAILIAFYSAYVGLHIIMGLSFLPVIPINLITTSIVAAIGLSVFSCGFYLSRYTRCLIYDSVSALCNVESFKTHTLWFKKEEFEIDFKLYHGFEEGIYNEGASENRLPIAFIENQQSFVTIDRTHDVGVDLPSFALNSNNDSIRL